MFQNFPNTTRRLAARGVLDNFEISLAVLLPNTATSHAINYTNYRVHNIYDRLTRYAGIIFGMMP